MLTAPTLEMLAFIRYLYNLAMEQSRQPEPTGTVSLLTFHDSVELFLDLACDQFGVPSKKTREFKDYWSALEPHLQGQSLSQKRSMERLNAARVNFKHHSIRLSSSDIENFRVNVSDFFQENTPLIFGIAFDKISITYLIQNTTVRSLLDEATALIEQGTTGEALNKIAIAFAHLIDDYMESKEAWRHRKLFFSKASSISKPRINPSNREFDDFVKNVIASIEALQAGMQVLSLGLDYQRYVQLRLLTPQVIRIIGDINYQVPPMKYTEDTLPSVKRCRFCYDFVVASAIHLQNFDFEVEL